ncbi:MAG: hypothetical protein AAF735_05180 [Myxococcota bacterium]
MREEFAYRAKPGYYLLFVGLFFGALAVFFGVSGYGLAFRNLTLAPYPWSMVATAVIAALFVIGGMVGLRNAKALNANPNRLTLEESSMSFPRGAQEKVVVAYRDVTQFWVKDDKDDGESVILYVGDDRHEFFAEYFDSSQDYVRFKTTIEQRCEAEGAQLEQ